MYIKNSTKRTTISKSAKKCEDILSITLGLMFSKKSKSLIFVFKKEKINPLHMFFVFYPIDVLFLDKNKIIVEMKENFKPFSFYNPKNKSKFVIELPQGTIEKSKTKLSDKIQF